MYLPFFVARKETKRQRSWHLVSPERTTRKSEAAKLRRYEVAGFSAGFSSLQEEGNQALSYICIANVRRNNLRSRL